GQAAIYNNLALAYRGLGLYRRSSRMAVRSMEIRRRLRDYANVVNGLTIVAGNACFAGNAEMARMYLGELEASRSLPGANSGGFWELGMDWFSGMVANLERDGAAAVPFFASTLRRVEPMPETSFQILALTDLCTAHLLAGDTEEALEASRRAVDLFAARERRARVPDSRPLTSGGGAARRWPRTANPGKRTARCRKRIRCCSKASVR